MHRRAYLPSTETCATRKAVAGRRPRSILGLTPCTSDELHRDEPHRDFSQRVRVAPSATLIWKTRKARPTTPVTAAEAPFRTMPSTRPAATRVRRPPRPGTTTDGRLGTRETFPGTAKSLAYGMLLALQGRAEMTGRNRRFQVTKTAKTATAATSRTSFIPSGGLLHRLE